MDELKPCLGDYIDTGVLLLTVKGARLYREGNLTHDFVSVVRCKDCKHMAIGGGRYVWCKSWERIVMAGDEGFCCYGERREE